MSTYTAEIRDNKLPTLRVPPGTVVTWHNNDSMAHSAETESDDEDYFNAGAIFPGGYSTPISFERPMKTKYLCRFHTNMEAKIVVDEEATEVTAHYEDDGDHDHGHKSAHHHDQHGRKHDKDHDKKHYSAHDGSRKGGHGEGGHALRHYHGFVTGGRSGDRLFMTHTPVLADTRHHFQVILRGHFAEPAHAAIYENLRKGPYGDQVVQIFHDHMEMADIGTGVIKLLPHAEVAYWPGGSKIAVGPKQEDIESLKDVPIVIDDVLHFHEFDTDAAYPDELTYLVYGDEDNVFIDHFINRAPSFHSVARLAAPPKGWVPGPARLLTVPGKAMRDVEAPVVTRQATVDNAFNVFWLLPPGFLPRQSQDPLIVRGDTNDVHLHEVRFEDGTLSTIEITNFVHFELRLLNYGVFIP